MGKKRKNSAVGRKVENKAQNSADNPPDPSNKTEDQNAEGASEQNAGGDQNAGSASEQIAGGDQNAESASEQIAGGASDQNPGGASASTSSDDRPIKDFRLYSYDGLKNGIDNFSRNCKIGEGRLGPVYKASLENGEIVTVMKLNVLSRQGVSLPAATKLSRLRHPNLVNLIGSSAECEDFISAKKRKQRFLVYEYIPSGTSLDKRLHELQPGEEPLDWATRMRIALGTAQALRYLHNYAKPPRVFSDLETSKVLLDVTLLPRLFGVGLANFGDQTNVISSTDGYCAPEYCATGTPTSAVDVYAFGVILLELITGSRPKDIIQEHGRKLYDWINSRNLYEVLDPVLKGKTGTTESLFRANELSLRCLRNEPIIRPIMREVVETMEGVVSKAISPTAGPDRITIRHGSAAANETRVEEDPQLAVEEEGARNTSKDKGKGKGKVTD